MKSWTMSRGCERGSIADSSSRMPEPLLDRQVRLLAHLTSGNAIFGVNAAECAPPGIHRGLLHLEARLSHEKRIQKIEWVLTRTLDLLGSSRAQIIRDFVEACPPTSIGWLANARQFHEFLSARWRHEAPEPPYLPDIASYELAYATVRAGRGDDAEPSDAPVGAVRRRPDAVLLRCAYDIRPILEGRGAEVGPAQRDTRLAVAMPPGTDEPLVSELSADLFELLEMIDEFVDPAVFEDSSGLHKLITDLAARGLVEVRR
jgi:hypothetical protein